MSAGILEQLLERVERVERELAELRASSPAQLVTVAAYAAARAVSEKMVRAAIADGRLPCTRVGRAVRVPADAAIAPAARREETAATRAERRLGLLRGGQP